ncbi:MAG: radical SAM protein, partial [Planctomycetaceae bacterium]|nr:radical SAM protein [Planctomycetaceae bacterium]
GKSGRAPFRLWHLFRQLDRIPGDWRMRLSSIEANEVDDDFINAAADCEHLCPQFHPALQSGSDGVLTRMRRRYRTGRFLEKLDRIRAVMPNVAFTTDMIVGFPGETEAEFEETMETCRQARFMKMHIFPFSPRKNTPAAAMEEQVSPEVRRERCRRLAELEKSLAIEYYRRLVGSRLEVLVERACDDRPGWVRGTDRTYAPVELPGGPGDVGQLVSAVAVEATPETLRGERWQA